MILDLDKISAVSRQSYLQHAIAPRPICFASTVDLAGQVNLSPFSFFNLFSITPPIIIFSPSRRIRDNTIKHSLENLREVPELVINVVDYDMVQQASLASCDYPRGINEFIKAGFTPEPATLVKPPMVKESKIRLECRALEIKSLGDQGGAGNLVICEVLRMHVDESILDEAKHIDPKKLPLVARLGGDWYCRVDATNLFQVVKPASRLGIGVDGLPDSIRNSPWLRGNDLGLLANVEQLPDIDPAFQDDIVKYIFHYFSTDPEEMEKELHRYARQLLSAGKVAEAWQVLLTL